VVSWTGDEWGALDILVNNAGVWGGGSPDLMTVPDEIFMTNLQVNVVAAYLCTKRLLPLLLDGYEPRVVNVGSSSGLFSPRLRSSYGVAKAALHAMTIATASELEGRVVVNGLSPGWVKTDMAPDAPGDPRWSAEGALSIVTRPFNVTGKLFHGKRQRSWARRFPS
jgi:NAD(P)-dependent dehydrogenase (short-subunit alcohol dehydrogenase family)